MQKKIKMNALKRSMQTKALENKKINIKFCDKKFSVQKALAYQNANSNGIEKIKRACRVKLRES